MYIFQLPRFGLGLEYNDALPFIGFVMVRVSGHSPVLRFSLVDILELTKL
jgi:hypothetical protein